MAVPSGRAVMAVLLAPGLLSVLVPVAGNAKPRVTNNNVSIGVFCLFKRKILFDWNMGENVRIQTGY